MTATPLPPAALQRLAMLTGHWRGETDAGGAIDEVWLPPVAGVAQGMVQYVEADCIRTIELILVAAESDRVVMRYHHFEPDYRAWEDDGPIALTLMAASADALLFSNLAAHPRHALEMGYRAMDRDTLASWVVAPETDGVATRHEFKFHRVR